MNYCWFNKKIPDAEEEKSQFFSDIFNEFQNIFKRILYPLEELAMHQLASDSRYQVSLAYQNATRFLCIINQFITLREIESNPGKTEYSSIDFLTLLKKIHELFTPLAKEKKIAFLLKTTEDSIPGKFDIDKLEKILCNLLSNAFLYTPVSGTILIKCRTNDKNCLTLTVSDNGPGMANINLDRNFENVNIFENKKINIKDGTRIDLALTKSLVKLLDGNLFVHSFTYNNPSPKGNTGTCYTIDLPVVPIDETASIDIRRVSGYDFKFINRMMMVLSWNHFIEYNEKPVQSGDSTNDTGCILIVTDNVELRSYLADIFVGLCRIVFVETVKEALSKAEMLHPEVVISDLMISGADSQYLISSLKTCSSTTSTPIILLAEPETDTRRIKSSALKPDYLFIKPFDTETLKNKVSILINSKDRAAKQLSNFCKFQTENDKIISHDRKFIEKTISIIEENIQDYNFDSNELSLLLGVSRSKLYKTIKTLLDIPVNDLIFKIRIKNALQILKEEGLSISETAYIVGFKTPSHFSRKFSEIIGMSPKAFLKKHLNRSRSHPFYTTLNDY